jgi:hypothetical protein
MAARGRRERRARRRKVAVAGSHLKAVTPGLDSATATSIPPGIKHQPAGREGGPPSQEGSIVLRHLGGTMGPDLTAVGSPRTRTDGSKKGADDAEGAAGAGGPVILQRGGAARVAPSSSGPGSVARSGAGQLRARTPLLLLRGRRQGRGEAAAPHCRGGRPDLLARRRSGGGTCARPPGLPCPPLALLYRTDTPLSRRSPHVAARQMHLRREEMYFYLSSLLGGKMPCAFALPVGEGICEVHC